MLWVMEHYILTHDTFCFEWWKTYTLWRSKSILFVVQDKMFKHFYFHFSQNQEITSFHLCAWTLEIFLQRDLYLGRKRKIILFIEWSGNLRKATLWKLRWAKQTWIYFNLYICDRNSRQTSEIVWLEKVLVRKKSLKMIKISNYFIKAIQNKP